MLFGLLLCSGAVMVSNEVVRDMVFLKNWSGVYLALNLSGFPIVIRIG
jgi:hypothetical protein